MEINNLQYKPFYYQPPKFQMLDNHTLVFNGMMTRLKIEESIQQNGSCDFNKGFNDLAEELFVQNEVSLKS